MLALLILVKVWYLLTENSIRDWKFLHVSQEKSSRNNITAIFQDKEENFVFCSKKIKENYLKRKEISSTRRYQSLNQMIITTIYVYLSAPRIQKKLSYFLMSELHVLSFILWKVTYGAFTWWWHFLLILKGLFCGILFDIF